jgi:hypothetical protein
MALEQAGFGGITVCGGHQQARVPRQGDQFITFEATRS